MDQNFHVTNEQKVLETLNTFLTKIVVNLKILE